MLKIEHIILFSVQFQSEGAPEVRVQGPVQRDHHNPGQGNIIIFAYTECP